MNVSCMYPSALGQIMLASDGEALTGLWLEGQKHRPKAQMPAVSSDALPVFEETVRWLDLYFDGKKPGFVPPLRWDATPFRETVWELLLEIPYGKTVTYGELAKTVAEKLAVPRMSAQAIGGAVGHNPISIIVPCHRVVGTDGSLTGYDGGVEIKARLLALEQGISL